MSNDAMDDEAGVPLAYGWKTTNPQSLPVDIPISPWPVEQDQCPPDEDCPPIVRLSREVSGLAETVDAIQQEQERHGRALGGIARGHEYLASEIAGLTLRVDERTSAHIAEIKAISTELQSNSAATARVETLVQGVSDVLAAGRVASSGVRWVGGMAKPVAVILSVMVGLGVMASDLASGLWSGVDRIVRAMSAGPK